MTKPTVLVTGGAGYIGSHILRFLRQHNYPTVTIDNLSTGWEPAVEDTPLYKGDIRNEKFLRSVFFEHTVDCVIHCAAMTSAPESIKHPLRYYDTNVKGTLSLLKAISEAGVQNFIFTSSSSVYGEPAESKISEDHPRYPLNPYGSGKMIIENILGDLSAQNIIRCVVLRCFNVAGSALEGGIGEKHIPETHLIPSLLSSALDSDSDIPFRLFGTDYKTRDGSAIRDFVHPLDVARAHEMAIDYLLSEQASTTLNIGTGKGYSVREVYEAACKITGLKISIEENRKRQGSSSCLVAETIKAKRTLGWRPNYSNMETILQSAWRWVQTPAF